jgi:hypothetical protein
MDVHCVDQCGSTLIVSAATLAYVYNNGVDVHAPPSVVRRVDVHIDEPLVTLVDTDVRWWLTFATAFKRASPAAPTTPSSFVDGNVHTVLHMPLSSIYSQIPNVSLEISSAYCVVQQQHVAERIHCALALMTLTAVDRFRQFELGIESLMCRVSNEAVPTRLQSTVGSAHTHTWNSPVHVGAALFQFNYADGLCAHI